MGSMKALRALGVSAMVTLVLAPLGARSAAAEEDMRERVGGENRVVGDHNFITPLYGKSAFNNGSFAFSQGFGVLSFTAPEPQFDANGQLVGFSDLDHNIFLYFQNLTAQIGIMNFLSIDLRASGFAAVAGNVDDIIGIGAFTNLNAGGFIRGRILTYDTKDFGLQLAAGIGADYDRTMNVTIRDYVQGVNDLIAQIANGEIEAAFANPQQVFQNANLITTISSVQVNPAVMLGFGTGPFGAQLTLQSSVDIGLDDGAVSATLGPDIHLAFDVAHYTGYFPFALTFEYSLNALVSGGSGTGHSIAGGFQFTGRRDINVGAFFAADDVTNKTISFMYGALDIQYFF